MTGGDISGVSGLLLSDIKRDGKAKLISGFSVSFRFITGTCPGKKFMVHTAGICVLKFPLPLIEKHVQVRVPQAYGLWPDSLYTPQDASEEPISCM